MRKLRVLSLLANPLRRVAWSAASLVALLALCACTLITPRANVPYMERPSPNFDKRRPNFVIIHHTSNDGAEHALSTLTDSLRRVSAHYLIARDGTIYYLVDEMARAWHAGESYWGGSRDLNSASIGIELDNNGDEPFTEPQIESLLMLLADLKERYKIPTANFLGHGDVATGRKTDPSGHFPWKRLAERGFGLWCEPPYPPVSEEIDAATLLAAVGYDTWDLDAALAAFKRHFVPEDASDEVTAEHRALMNCLVAKKTSDER
ncbi:MAG: N-acetylmuramoyl-L-alanine amidase [Betaproteobacteria bacterium]|nr:N-acetylmuramoyl-L-alanine amidase [Betaproteobacteria bacterium]MDH3437081.1 N-acetylmuramoyl-L-alanine amidase [Betaproteobacteria bacterium]